MNFGFHHKMNELQTLYCEKILQNILSQPVASLFYDYSQYTVSEMSETYLTFKYVSEKLSRSLYPSIEAFINDMIGVLSSASKLRRFCIRKAAAEYLMKLIPDPQTAKLQDDAAFLDQADNIDKLFATAINKCEEEKPPNKPTKSTVEPASFIVTHEKQIYTPENLYELVSLIRDPEQIVKIAQFIYQIQPECICIAENLTFVFSLMREETADATGKFLIELIKDASVIN